MMNFAEVLAAQAEERGAIKLRVSAHVIIGMRMQLLAIAVMPHFLGLVMAFEIDYTGIPVVLLPRNITAALQQEDSLPCWRKLVHESSPASAAADDNDIISVISSHEVLHNCSGRCRVR